MNDSSTLKSNTSLGVPRGYAIAFLSLLLAWSLLGLNTIHVIDQRNIERQNMETGVRFLEWTQLFSDTTAAPFGAEELNFYWHGHSLHPNVPVILMALIGKTNGTLSLKMMRAVPLIFGLTSVLLLVLWAVRERGFTEAGALGILLLLYPHILRRSSIASTATSVTIIWIIVLWILSKERKSLWMWIIASVLFGIGLGTKITILLLPISYGIALFAYRPSLKDSPGRILKRWAIFLLTGLAVHIALWPWLWHNPIGNMYLHIMENRVQSNTGILFFGNEFSRPPFFYPLWFLLMTVPLPLILLFIVGLVHIIQKRLWKTSFWTGLHFWTMALFLCIFCFPVKSALNGAEYFLPAFFSMATISVHGIAFLAGTDHFVPTPKSTRLLLVFTILTVLSIAINILWSGDFFLLRNLIGNLLNEPFAGSF